MDSDVIFNIKTTEDFEATALQIFKYQYENNNVYQTFCNHFKTTPAQVKKVTDIPFLPIQFFKSHKVISGTGKVLNKKFTSSGTTGNIPSTHYVNDISIYEKSYLTSFKNFYGTIENYTVLALLPSYLEREGSSLIYMANDLIDKSQSKESGFYLNNLSTLKDTLIRLDNSGEKILLIGVTFALLDLIEQESFQLKNTIIMETGGMKGRRKELIRKELHEILCNGFGVSKIHSEYGMTELLSQAYSKGNGIFECPPWMKIYIRDPEDALTIMPFTKNGGINIIDLANIHSCSFIATQDLGKVYENRTFEVIGRFDNSDIRGCNLMAL